MLSLLEHPKHYLLALAYHEAFRRLGFKPEEIYVSLQYSPDGSDKQCLLVVLRSQGKQFAVQITTKMQVTDDEFKEQWASATQAWNGASSDDHDKVWDAWCETVPIDRFLLGLIHKGFVFADKESLQVKEAKDARAN